MAKPRLDPTQFEDAAAAALARRDFERAFAFADRRCRAERPAEATSHVLRADALFGLGERRAALEDIERALTLEPANPHANRRLMAWGDAAQRVRAAAALAPSARDLGLQRSCARVLREAGQRAFAAAAALHAEIVGWAYWAGDAALEITCDDGQARHTAIVEPDASAPLGEAFAASAQFHVPRPASARQQHITIAAQGEALFATSVPANRRLPSRPLTRPQAACPTGVAVIVPIHGDRDATEACLSSLLRQFPLPGVRIILVDDASPDPRIAALLDETARHPSVELLRNGHNLGFVGAVNRALAACGNEDVILLNADTIVPAGFVARLKAAAHASPDIGTVTPLSNNGELTSFPVFARANPLPTPAEIDRLDRTASRVNAGLTVDLPNGIGFCLYLKRACLDAVGPLSEGYQRGYYEDVDWCLAARERGFRNVCACDVFVGHVGTRSFGGEKRGLVLRNLAVLEQRYPEHIAEVAAFVAADPLRPARAALEISHHPSVTAGLGPAIHEFSSASSQQLVDARAKPGHDGVGGDIPPSPPPSEPLGVLATSPRHVPLLKRLALLTRKPVTVLGAALLGMEGIWPEKLIATGALSPDELPALMARYRIGALLLLGDEAHTLRAAAFRAGTACAYLDASRNPARTHDLALDPTLPLADQAKAIALWAAA